MNRLNKSLLVFAAATLVAASSAHAADGTWITDLGTSPWTTTTNWAGDIVADGSGSTAFFTNDISADNTVTLGAPQTIGNLVFDDAGATGDSAWTISGSTLTLAGTTPTITTHTNATISSILSGTAGLTKTGTGTLTLSGANTYTGGTTISEGLLRVNAQSYPKDGNNRTTLGAMSVASGATLDLINTGAANSYGSPGVIVLRDLTLSGAGTVVTSGTGVTDFWDGDNAVNLTAFTGTFHATGGTMAFQINQARTSGVNAMILDSGAYLDLRTNGGITLSSLTGTGKVGSSYTANQVLTVGALNASSQFDGVIQNTVPGFANSPTIALRKIGSGTLTLTGANTYTGTTTIDAGTLAIQNPGNNVWGSNITVNSGATLNLVNTLAGYANRGTHNNQKAISGDGSLVVSGGGWVVMSGVNNTVTLTGGISVLSGGLGNDGGATSAFGTNTSSLSVSSGAAFDLRGGASQFDALNGAGVIGNSWNGTTLTLGVANGSGTFSGVIQSGGPLDSGTGGGGGALALIKNGTGTQTLSGSNTYTGGLTVNGGTLNYTGAGSVTGGGGAVNIASGATLNLSGAGNNQLEATGVLTIAGTLAVTTNSANTLRGTSIVLNGGTMTSSGGNGGAAATYGAFFTGDKNMTVTANGTGNFISGNGDFGIQNGRTLTLATPLLADGLTVSTAFKGVGGTAGALAKTGLGTVTLSGASSYTGLTTISGGTLLVNGNNGAATGALGVASGATLGGTGIIGSLLSTVDGNITGGTATAVGTLSTQALTLGATGVYLAQIDSGSLSADRLTVSGALTLTAGSTLTLDDLGIASVINGTKLTLASYTTITGTFANYMDGQVFALGSNQWQIAYNDSNAITLTAVPEPSTYGLIGAGALAAVAMVRRRRKAAGKAA